MPMARQWCPGCDRDVPVAPRALKHGGELVYRHHHVAPGAATVCPMSRKAPLPRRHLTLVHSAPAWQVQRHA